MIGRRGFITGLVAVVAAPAIVRAGSLMPVKVVDFGIVYRNPLPLSAFDEPAILAQFFDLDALVGQYIDVMRVPREWLVQR